MKKWLSRLVAGTLALVSTFGLVACGGGGDDDLLDSLLQQEGIGGGGSEEKVIDLTKTQLLVKYYNAGFGDAWINKLIARFEEAYKDVEYEDNKKGIQVWATGERKDYTGQDVANSSYDVYFMENANYYAMVSVDGALENLTDIVTDPVKGPDGTTNLDGGKTIASKLTKQQKEFYGITSVDGDPKYYGIPHYEGGYGLVYNKELFDAEGYYIVEGDEFGILKDNPGATLCKGPDGKPNTVDDGLPATYKDFYALCDEISVRGDYPFCWSGQYREPYLTTFVNTLVAETVGAEQMELSFSFTGEAKDLVVFDNGSIVYENGKIKTEAVDITTANGYELARQEARYYALEFLDKMINSDGWYNKDTAFKGSHSHLDAQYDFIKGGTDQDASGKAYAFLVDGPWWEGEATAKFTQMSFGNDKYKKQNRDFAWMPLPKATEKYVGGEKLYMDNLNAITVVKAGLGEKTKAALDFVRYSVTDESLVEFTQTTGALKSYNYTLSDEQKAVLSPFAKSVIDYKENATTFVMNSGNPFFVGNYTTFVPVTKCYTAGGYTSPVQAFAQGESVKSYYKQLCGNWADYKFWE